MRQLGLDFKMLFGVFLAFRFLYFAEYLYTENTKKFMLLRMFSRFRNKKYIFANYTFLLLLLSDSSNGNGCESNTSINYQFITVAAQWFDHVVSEVKNTEHQFSVKKYSFHCESDHSIRKVRSKFLLNSF